MSPVHDLGSLVGNMTDDGTGGLGSILILLEEFFFGLLANLRPTQPK